MANTCGVMQEGICFPLKDACLMLLLELRQEVRPLRAAWRAPGTTVFCALSGKSH